MVGLGLLPQASHQNLLLYPSGLEQSSDPNDPQQLLNGLSHEQLQQLQAQLLQQPGQLQGFVPNGAGGLPSLDAVQDDQQQRTITELTFAIVQYEGVL